MADHPQTPPRQRVVIYRDADDRWRWVFTGRHHNEMARGWSRIESCVANMAEVLGVETEWVKFRQGQRRLVVIGRSIDVEIRR